MFKFSPYTYVRVVSSDFTIKYNMFKFIDLLRTENTYTLTRLSTFVFNAFGIRNKDYTITLRLFECRLFECRLFECILFECRLFECRMFECRLFECRLFESGLFECRMFECRMFECRMFECRMLY